MVCHFQKFIDKVSLRKADEIHERTFVRKYAILRGFYINS